MRNYNCYYSVLKNDFLNIKEYACWSIILESASFKSIYIDVRYEEYDKKAEKRIVWLINKITPCEVVEIDKKSYIKYTFIECKDFYHRNLLLLNFIRYLWNEPKNGMSENFFKELIKTRGNKDIIYRLTTANKDAYPKIVNDHYDANGNHSNAYKYAKIKTTEEFLKHNFTSVKYFIT